jgi:ribosome-binding protein aMBF1 (putative translation factor)
MRRLRQTLRRTPPGQVGGLPAPAYQDPLQNAGLVLRQARESRGLGLRQLAQDTRISTPVLEALERGWSDRLPEAATLEVRRDLETFREVFFGKQSRGEVPGNKVLLAELDRLESARC